MRLATSIAAVLAVLLSACATTSKLALPEFTAELEKIQAMSDEQGQHQQALEGFLGMRGRLGPDSLRVQYETGIEVSTLWLADRAGQTDLVEKQIAALLEAPNRRFIAMEVHDSTSRPGFVFNFWARGWTHPLVRLGYTLPEEIAKAQSPAARAGSVTRIRALGC